MRRTDLLEAAERVARAVDARTAGRYTWQIGEVGLEVSIEVVSAGDDRLLASLRSAGGAVEVRTPTRTSVLDATTLEAVVDELARAAAARLTRFDLRPGRRYLVMVPCHGLSAGAELELVLIDEHKPSGRNVYRFQHARGSLELLDDEPGARAFFDEVGRFLGPPRA